ncbi:MAG: pyruvate dehydrogenase (acetyl-transferring), homodimeric type, partial [Halioglobus sp.]
MPPMPETEEVQQGIIRGAYCCQPRSGKGLAVDLLASGALMQQAIEASAILQDLGYAPAIWSVTSYIELARQAEACERAARLSPLEEAEASYLHKMFGALDGPIIAVSDYQKSLSGSIARWMPKTYTVLGTDGFGVSGSRPELRDHFEVSVKHIVQAALVAFHRQGDIDEETLKRQLAPLGIEKGKADPAGR